mgnify:CR=1 FL=1
MAVAALVLGIVSVVFAFIPGFYWIGLITGVIGIILGALAKKQASNGMATAGLVCSIIGVVFCAITFIACAACVGAIGSLA